MSITAVRVLAEAADELETAAAFYDSRKPGLGDEFWDVPLADIESVEDYAGIHAKHCGYHRMLAKRFPYAVYYRIHSDIAYVVAVLPLRRDPKWIARRLGRGYSPVPPRRLPGNSRSQWHRHVVLIKELIHIPEKVQRGDFVLTLASGLAPEAIEQTLAEYVVTPQLARCFEDALSFVKSAVTSAKDRNKGAYLHWSFGSGKSHFMPVLSLLMAGHPRVRAIAELAPAVSRLTLLYALPAMIGRDWSGCCVIVLARPSPWNGSGKSTGIRSSTACPSPSAMGAPHCPSRRCSSSTTSPP